MPDIDIDFADRNNVLDKIKHVPATIVDKDGTFKKHNTGVYCTAIPHNPLTGTASIDYKSAEDRGYFKIDFLNVSLYQQIKNEEQLIRLINTEPLWDLLARRFGRNPRTVNTTLRRPMLWPMPTLLWFK